MLTALVVVLAAVVFFWLTGDKNKKPERPRGAAEQLDAKQKPDGRDAAADGKETKSAKESGEKKPLPGWKRAMGRGRRSGETEAEPAREPEQERPVSPHAPGSPKR